VHPLDLVAQAAGHLDRDNYVSDLGLNPEYMEEFKEMFSLLWTTLKSQVEQIKQVGQSTSRRHICNCCSNENWTAKHMLCFYLDDQYICVLFLAWNHCMCTLVMLSKACRPNIPCVFCEDDSIETSLRGINLTFIDLVLL